MTWNRINMSLNICISSIGVGVITPFPPPPSSFDLYSCRCDSFDSGSLFTIEKNKLIRVHCDLIAEWKAATEAAFALQSHVLSADTKLLDRSSDVKGPRRALNPNKELIALAAIRDVSIRVFQLEATAAFASASDCALCGGGGDGGGSHLVKQRAVFTRVLCRREHTLIYAAAPHYARNSNCCRHTRWLIDACFQLGCF